MSRVGDAMGSSDCPPVLIGEKVLWLGSGSGVPKSAKVRWIGRLQEIGPEWAVGLELDDALPYGGIDGAWGHRRLFMCQPKHGLIVPSASVTSMPARNYRQLQCAKKRDCLKNGVIAVQAVNPPVIGPPFVKALPEKKVGAWRPVPKSQTKFSVRNIPLKDEEGAPPPRTKKAIKPFDSRLLESNSIQDNAGALQRSLGTVENSSGGLQAVRIDRQESHTSYSIVVGDGDTNDVFVTRRMDEFKREYKAYGDSEESVRLSKTGSSSRSVGSSQSGGSKKSSGGFFSFLKWFKRDKSEEEEEDHEGDTEDPSAPNSPALRRAHSSSICGSVDTLFSTATAASFAYVHPSYYRPFGAASQAETRIAEGPETSTYRNRIRERDRARLLENNISLREKYNLYASGTLRRSADHIHEIVFNEGLDDILKPIENSIGSKNSTLSRKKRRAPPPPFKDLPSSDLSLPATLTSKSTDIKYHRRTVSESAKYKVNYHVKGKRKAPPPPDQKTEKCFKLDVDSVERNNSGKKKRPAPPPPAIEHDASSSIVEIVNEAALEIINDAGKNSRFPRQDSKEETVSNASTVDVELVEVSTDTLRLEKGVLKPNRMDRPISDPKVAPTSPVSPRPWYKRGSTVKEQPSGSANKKKEKERKIDEWMLESGFPRRTSLLNADGSKFNIFSKLEKPEEKRKSQISILTNISELDREAAEIVQKGKAREQALLASHDAKYYTNNDDTATNGVVEEITTNEDVEIPKKSSTRELISLFNAITNVTKVTVNASLFSKEGSNIFKRENNSTLHEEQKSEKVTFRESKVKETAEVSIGTRDVFPGAPGNTRQIVSTFEVKNSTSITSGVLPETDKKIARVTIEELDEYDAESPAGTRAQAMFEANRLTRRQSPTIPTIVEVSESSVRTSPASTVESITTDVGPEPSAPPNRGSVWVCPRCTLENMKWKITCEACDMWRPLPPDIKPDTQPSTSKGHLYNKPLLETIALPGISNPAFKKSDKEPSSKIEPATKPSDIKTVINTESPTTNFGPGTNNNDAVETTEENVKAEEVRKARLAYFNKSNEEGTIVKDTQTTNELKSQPKYAEEERMMLREMLKEMKHSLPKRPKNVARSEVNTKNEIGLACEHSGKKDSVQAGNEQKTGAIRKVPKADSAKDKRYAVNSKRDLAEAYLVDSETRVEEIKVKKPSEKVSSSAQTSAMVRQIAPQVKAPSSQPKEVIVPITIEEYTLKDGKVEMSISRQAKRIGTGTFELMRPRDFASIEAIKTGSKAGPIHFYANVPDEEKTEQTSPAFPMPSTSKATEIASASSPSVKVSFGGVNDSKPVNTLAVNRLLKKLETAIANGQHDLAAGLAKDLARLKISCSVTRQKPESTPEDIMVEMYVEDKVSHQGPIPLRVRPSMKVIELKQKLEKEFEIPVGVQRWILGKQLANNDTATLQELGVNTGGAPVFLYLVAPDVGLLKEAGSAAALEPSAPVAAIEEILKEDTPPKDREEEADDNSSYCGDDERSTENSPELENPEDEVQGAVQPIIEEPPDDVPAPQPLRKEIVTGTLAFGWKCARCTLMNSPTRPGCAACTMERPHAYVVPVQYRASESEIARLGRDQLVEEEAARALEEDKKQNYQKLMDLEKDELVISVEDFECPVCLVEYQPMEGVVLHECLHTFCRTCLANTVEYSEEAEVKCPYRDNDYTCDGVMLEREIKALVSPQVYEQHLAKSIALAETNIGNAFHCKTPDCKGWCIYEDNVNTFRCPVCTHTNCLTCQAIHEGLDCKQFQEQLNEDSPTSVEAKRTKEMLKEMVDRGEAMNCPTCQVVLMKKWGCDWLRCSMCKTEICWVTRGPRWGPSGKGDTSGGCQCGVNGVKCHPKCNYCH